jgi:two-component system response regulator HydG
MQERTKILVIDDDEDIRSVLQQILKRSNYEVDLAKDARQGLVKLWTNRYDLALTDILLPDINGLKLLSIVLATPLNVDFIVITGDDSSRNQDEAFRLGAHGYFVKPFDPNDLLILIQQIIANRKLKGLS